ncbi:MAG: hypothetical protein NT051_02250 [Candidatus Micrarchaeota archaeon]|nr:hypothetical protein [Candidatus Micrarchaeota archaeon]
MVESFQTITQKTAQLDFTQIENAFVSAKHTNAENLREAKSTFGKILPLLKKDGLSETLIEPALAKLDSKNTKTINVTFGAYGEGKTVYSVKIDKPKEPKEIFTLEVSQNSIEISYIKNSKIAELIIWDKEKREIQHEKNTA